MRLYVRRTSINLLLLMMMPLVAAKRTLRFDSSSETFRGHDQELDQRQEDGEQGRGQNNEYGRT